jgi:hypothetical protein
MSIQLSISGAKQLGDGVWSAVVDRSELSYLGGRPAEGGERSVVLVTNALYENGSLKLRPSASSLANLGSSNEVIFVDRLVSADQFNEVELAAPQLARNMQASLANRAPEKGSNYYWVTVGKNLQDNFELALTEGVWGVDSKYSARIQPVKKDDYIVFYGKEFGFALCRVSSSWFEDRSRVWPDGVYPYRVKIGTPVLRNHTTSLSDMFQCLLDPDGHAYGNVNAAGRAIGGAAGVFRPLAATERQRLFDILGWPIEPNGGE